MNKDEMLDGIMLAAGISRANINRFYEGLIALAKRKLAADGEFTLPGLGVLKVKTRSARDGRNPKTGERIRIPLRKVVRFGAYKDLKEILNRSTEDSEEEDPSETSED